MGAPPSVPTPPRTVLVGFTLAVAEVAVPPTPPTPGAATVKVSFPNAGG